MSGTENLDLGTISDLHEYLAGTPFESHRITALSGGNVNFTFRLELKAPYQGRPTLVVKHAKSYVMASGTQVPFALLRQTYEVEALKRAKDIPSRRQIVTVPTVHRFDKEAGVIIMDDCGVNALTLKRFMQEGRSNPALGEEIGSALGEFLGNLHVWGEGNLPVIDLFEGNKQAKEVSAWATYGRLVSTLSNQDDLPALRDPPINVSSERLEMINKASSETALAMTSTRSSFVMGDFWPGNIMIAVDEMGALERLHVLDWEAAGTGFPAMDVGQFRAEMELLRRFNPECEVSAARAIATFQETYSGIYRPDISFARMAIVRWGAHFVTWTPRVAWGSNEKTREVVVEGAELIVEGYYGESEEEIWSVFRK